jgi:hypothetical protein
MRKDELREMVRNIVEELCAKGKAYRKKRMAAGEKSSAYLSGRAVKVCKGQIKGEAEDAAMKKSALGMAMYGKSMNEQEGQVNVFGYQTKHFDICPGAQGLYKKITDEKLKEDAIKSAKLHDALFAMEKQALKSGANEEDVKKAQQIADAIMKLAQKMGLKAEHQYVQGHVDKIKDTLTKVDEAKKKEDDEEGVASNTEFKLTLKHLLDKHVVKGGLKKVKK